MNTSNPSPVLIELMDIVDGTSTNPEGYLLFMTLNKLIDAGKKVKISLKDCTPMSSSFLSSSFGALYDKYGIAKVKSSISLTNFIPSRAGSIKTYLDNLQKYVK